MKRTPAQESLNVFLNERRIGTLIRRSNQGLAFSYDPDWVRDSQAFPISCSLPLTEEEYGGERVRSYFDNLLPDDLGMRQSIAATVGVRPTEIFELLDALGKECVGALQFVRPDQPLPDHKIATGAPVSDSEIARVLRRLSTSPLGIEERDAFRFSVAGAQEKSAFLLLNGRWHTPEGLTPSTHLFKPELDMPTGRSLLRNSVENEWLCAQMMGLFNVPTTKCEIVHFDEVKTLVVERFDRVRAEQKILRIPQEDLCQALGIPSEKKYESDGGPSLKDVMNILNSSLRRDEDRTCFMKAQIVFILLGAIDGHAKNFSLSWSPAGFLLAPLYDILSVYPLVERGDIALQKAKMAMSYGERRTYKLQDISRRHLLQSAELCRFDPNEMDHLIQQTIDELPQVIDRARVLAKGRVSDAVAQSIFRGATNCARRFFSS